MSQNGLRFTLDVDGLTQTATASSASPFTRIFPPPFCSLSILPATAPASPPSVFSRKTPR
ncbi:hypothetical protein CWG85_23845 [Salmonella enterica subsp. enterica serovar Adelaide]|nr:hypothetical protein [Salmonella enterica subsp. enterica serovar Adelaide]